MNKRTLFGTPLAQTKLEIPATNTKLKEILLSMEGPTLHAPRSNAGGWQSEPLELRTEDCFKSLHLHSLNCLHQTVGHKSKWRHASWANINRKGNYHLPHTHPNSDWSSVYYVDVGDKCEESTDRAKAGSGNLLLLDPRGSVETGRTNPKGKDLYEKMFGASVMMLKPFTGLIVFFPSWLNHQVLTYNGDTPRISIATNWAMVGL